ncbi:YjgB family protein [Paenibacillus typhae]|uniref:YjgB family protein n=1 Tax=Paenibacillus typhae TaxID=1174501 RepID=UPI001C8D10C9|nr:YjgB family protein [Paenibacillus typhae]MBY0014380.1 YjgB family protein [Paenibacillus typhae]
MTTTFKTITGIMILASALGLSACSSSGSNTGNNAASTNAPVAEASTPAQPASTASPSPAAAEQSAPPAATAAPDTAAGNGAAAEDSATQLKELLELAKQGKVPGVEYAAHSGMIDEVEAAWGEPDTKESAGKGMYSTYGAKHVVFGWNKGSRIFDVRSSATDLQQLTLKEIEQTLGKPDDTAVNGSDKIYIYHAGKEYQLKFIIPEATGTVDHISVFSEQDSFNNMAG